MTSRRRFVFASLLSVVPLCLAAVAVRADYHNVTATFVDIGSIPGTKVVFDPAGYDSLSMKYKVDRISGSASTLYSYDDIEVHYVHYNASGSPLSSGVAPFGWAITTKTGSAPTFTVSRTETSGARSAVIGTRPSRQVSSIKSTKYWYVFKAYPTDDASEANSQDIPEAATWVSQQDTITYP